MNPYVEILRVNVGLLALFAVLAGGLMIGTASIYQVLIACSSVFLISSGGNVLNDYFDLKADKINKPKRPLSSGRIKVKTALIYSIILFVLGNMMALFLNQYMFILALFNSLFIVVYNRYLKRMPIGNLVESWLVSSCFIFGGLISLSIPLSVMILAIMGYFGNTGREITKALEDIRGDKKSGYRTFPIVFGEKMSRYIVILFVLAAIAVSPLPYILGYFGTYFMSLLAFADLLLIYSLGILFKDYSDAQKLMKFAMAVGILAFLLGTI